VEAPAVVIAAQPAFFDEPVAEIGPPVGAMALQQAVLAAEIAVEHETLAQQAYGFDRIAFELVDAGNRMPVPAHHLAHGGTRANPGQLVVLLLAEHGRRLPRSVGLEARGRDNGFPQFEL